VAEVVVWTSGLGKSFAQPSLLETGQYHI
jgi:hypothetical protein